jgi:hypothetical protein
MDFISQISALACSSSSTHVVRVKFNSLISACKDSQETHGKKELDSSKEILLLALRSSFKATQKFQGIEALDFNKLFSETKSSQTIERFLSKSS